MATLNAAGDANNEGTTGQPQGTATSASGVKGVVAQYQKSGIVGGNPTQTNIVPAGPGWRIAGSDSKGATNNNIIGNVPPGKPGEPQVRTTIQNSTDPLICSAAQATGEVIQGVAPSSSPSSTPPLPTGKPVQQADNFLQSTATLPSAAQLSDVYMGIPKKNDAQKASAGLSLSQETE